MRMCIIFVCMKVKYIFIFTFDSTQTLNWTTSDVYYTTLFFERLWSALIVSSISWLFLIVQDRSLKVPWSSLIVLERSWSLLTVLTIIITISFYNFFVLTIIEFRLTLRLYKHIISSTIVCNIHLWQNPFKF